MRVFTLILKDMAVLAINGFIRDISDPNPLVRALAIRTMSYINVHQVIVALLDHLALCLKDADPYVAKTACLAVAKLYSHAPDLVLPLGLIDQVRSMAVEHENSNVVTNACAALYDMGELGVTQNFSMKEASRLIIALNEWYLDCF